MDGVVLIRSLDGCMVFYCPPAVGPAPVAVGTLSVFFEIFWVAILGRFWEPAGTPKSTKNIFLLKNGAPGSSFLTIFAARAFFLVLFIDFPSTLT